MLDNVNINIETKKPVDVKIDVSNNVLLLAGLLIVGALLYKAKK